VEPILEVLVGRVLEQGLMEVMEEEELAAMRAHQRQMQALRDAGAQGGHRRGRLLHPPSSGGGSFGCRANCSALLALLGLLGR
jgi:hypothetical protein